MLVRRPPLKLKVYHGVAVQNPQKTSVRAKKSLKDIFCGTPCILTTSLSIQGCYCPVLVLLYICILATSLSIQGCYCPVLVLLYICILATSLSIQGSYCPVLVLLNICILATSLSIQGSYCPVLVQLYICILATSLFIQGSYCYIVQFQFRKFICSRILLSSADSVLLTSGTSLSNDISGKN